MSVAAFVTFNLEKLPGFNLRITKSVCSTVVVSKLPSGSVISTL